MSPNDLKRISEQVKELISLHNQVVNTLFDLGLIENAREFAKVLARLQEANEHLLAKLNKFQEAGLAYEQEL